MRPSIDLLRSFPTIPSKDAVDGWELKLESPSFKMRYWLGSYITSCSEFEAAAADWQTPQGDWTQVDYYTKADYETS
jgi:hypothetical protein